MITLQSRFQSLWSYLSSLFAFSILSYISFLFHVFGSCSCSLISIWIFLCEKIENLNIKLLLKMQNALVYSCVMLFCPLISGLGGKTAAQSLKWQSCRFRYEMSCHDLTNVILFAFTRMRLPVTRWQAFCFFFFFAAIFFCSFYNSRILTKCRKLSYITGISMQNNSTCWKWHK